MDKRQEKSRSKFVVCGNFIHSTEKDPFEILKDMCVGIIDGKIVFVEPIGKLEDKVEEYSVGEADIIQLEEWQFVIPGFVDTHIHAPQYPNAGKGLDKGLLEWLEKYTFPTEAKFKNVQYAQHAYSKAVKRVLNHGTTTACYFATIHTDASLVLCDIIDKFGQRGLVGKVNMNQNAPAYYIEQSTEESVKETKRFVDEVLARQYDLITPVITPRFSVNCSDKLLKELGNIAREYNLPIQTHICESVQECELVSKLFPDALHYTDTYCRAGLLTDRTVLAHGIYLTEPELDVIHAKGSSVSHCPNSNLSIRSGLLDVRKLMKRGIKVGLGTDVSGGYHPSMLDAIRTTVHVSNTQAILHQNGYRAITTKEAFGLATLGGSRALGLEHVIGNFEVGKAFDALVIDPRAHNSSMDDFDEDTLEDTAEKFLHIGDDRNIIQIFVAGRIVK